ncbi:MAG: hypothetical protein ABSH04_08395, partial [Acidimicrobiales bacterium]
MALGAGVLTGLTAATVLSTSSPASAAAIQVPNCVLNSGSGYEYNQLQNGTTLVPFMLFGGTAISPTAGDTVSVVCTGLPTVASGSALLVGVTNPIAAFVDHFSGSGTFGLNMFLGGLPSFVATDNGPARSSTATGGSLGAVSSGTAEVSYLSSAVSAGATSRPLAGYRTGSSSGAGLPVTLSAGQSLFIGNVCVPSGTTPPCTSASGAYETTTVSSDYTAKTTSIGVSALAHGYAKGTPVIVPYTYTIPTTGANDTDATCPPSAAQVAIGLTNCALAIADLSVDEYGFAYINFTGQNPSPATTSVTGFSGLTTAPPLLTVTNVTNSVAGALGGNTSSTYNGTSSALPGDTVELDSVSGAEGTFWADPYGSLSEPLTIEVIDSNGTAAQLNTTDTQGLSSSSNGDLSIVPDVYYPGGTSVSCGFVCKVTGTGGGGTFTGGTLAKNTSGDTWNPNSGGEATDEVIPTEGYNAAHNDFQALAPGPLNYLVVQPDVAPPGDGSYDVANVTCTTTCPIPGNSPITQIATLSAAAGPGPTSPYPFTVLSLSAALSGLPSGGIPPGYPLVL